MTTSETKTINQSRDYTSHRILDRIRVILNEHLGLSAERSSKFCFKLFQSRHSDLAGKQIYLILLYEYNEKFFKPNFRKLPPGAR